MTAAIDPAFLQRAQEASADPDLAQAVQRFFAFLADSPSGREALADIAQHVRSIALDGDQLTCELEAGLTWRTAAPGSAPRGVPAELAAVLARCSWSALQEPAEDAYVGLHDGTAGTLHALGPDGIHGLAYDESLCAPIDMGFSKYYLYMPATGELARYDHDGGLSACPGLSVGTAFLSELRARLRTKLELQRLRGG